MVIETTADFCPKGQDARRVPIEDHIASELAQLRIDDRIIEGSAVNALRRLGAWMKSLGWTTKKKAHELRKLYGWQVAMHFGLFAAQRLLGYKDPKVTSRYYADLVDLPKVRIFG